MAEKIELKWYEKKQGIHIKKKITAEQKKQDAAEKRRAEKEEKDLLEKKQKQRRDKIEHTASAEKKFQRKKTLIPF